MNSHFVITSVKEKEDKGSMHEYIQGIRGITSGFDKANRNTLFKHSSSAPCLYTILTATTSCISSTNAVQGKERVGMVGKQSDTLQWPIGYTTTGTDPYSDRYIQQGMGSCILRDQNRASVVQEGTLS